CASRDCFLPTTPPAPPRAGRVVIFFGGECTGAAENAILRETAAERRPRRRGRWRGRLRAGIIDPDTTREPRIAMSTAQNTRTDRLSVTEKVGYSLGDLAANLIFQTLTTFLAFFYTDIYRIPAGTAATIIFVVGMLGAFVFTPLVAVLADRTNSRWGKFRPWVLWTAVPFGVLSLLAFTTPDLGPQGKVFYAAATYTLLVLVYAANNLPYS